MVKTAVVEGCSEDRLSTTRIVVIKPKWKRTIRYTKNLRALTSSSSKKASVTSNSPVCESSTCQTVPKISSWDLFLSSPSNLKYVAPVSYFKHSPLADIWEDFALTKIGQIIELPNPYIQVDNGKVNWVGEIMAFAGYKALVEFERFGLKPNHVSWISFCSTVPKPVGFSTRHKILLYPMTDVVKLFPNYIDTLADRLKSFITINEDHGKYVRLKIKANQQRYPLKSKVEALDRSYIARMRVATVTGYIGDRVHITYDIEPVPNDAGFVFSVHSDSIHPIGWAKEVGIEIFDPIETDTVFPVEELRDYPQDIVLEVGQLLEARHPLYPYIISEATVTSVLRHGYFMVSFKCLPQELRRPTCFWFHITSPYIFAVGFCKRNNIQLQKLKTKKKRPSSAPLHLLPPRPQHQFKKGLKLEASDVCDPGYLGPVTIMKVAEHLLRLHYDGWEIAEKNMAWMSADSANIFPLGYAELTGHKFDGTPSLP